jgi:hypothetical protein
LKTSPLLNPTTSKILWGQNPAKRDYLPYDRPAFRAVSASTANI